MSTTLASFIFIPLWFISLNLPWLIKAKSSYLKWRMSGWLVGFVLIAALGLYLDSLTFTAPHKAYSSGTFYVTFVLFSCLISCPGVFYFKAQQNKKITA